MRSGRRNHHDPGSQFSVAKLIPFNAEHAGEEELSLVAAGAMRLPEKHLDLDLLWSMPKAIVSGNAATQAVLDERDEGR